MPHGRSGDVLGCGGRGSSGCCCRTRGSPAGSCVNLAVPLLTKAVPLLAAIYLVSPLDLVPDVLPLLGQVMT